MKKVLILMFRMAALFILLSSPSFALDFILGARSGYFVWDPYIKDIKTDVLSGASEAGGVLYGPVMSLIFTRDLSLSASGLFGKQSAHWYSPNEITTLADGSQAERSGTYFMDVKRADMDSALSYRIIANLKLFAGYKYQFIDVSMRYTERIHGLAAGAENVVNDGSVKIEIPAHGPMLGLGYTQALGNAFFAVVNISGLYMRGRHDIKNRTIREYKASDDLSYAASSLQRNEDVSHDTSQAGISFEPQAGFMAGGTGVIILIGVRLQYMWIRLNKTYPDIAKDKWMSDTLYGGFVSVLYAF